MQPVSYPRLFRGFQKLSASAAKIQGRAPGPRRCCWPWRRYSTRQVIPCRGNRSEVNREQWGTYQGKGLCQRAQMKRGKHALAGSDHTVVPFVSDTLGSMTEESTVMLCLFPWCQAV